MYAYEESEKYKEGKFIIERHYLAKQSKNFHAPPAAAESSVWAKKKQFKSKIAAFWSEKL